MCFRTWDVQFQGCKVLHGQLIVQFHLKGWRGTSEKTHHESVSWWFTYVVMQFRVFHVFMFLCFFNHEGSTGKFIHLSHKESLKAYRNLSRSTHYNKYHCDMFSRVTISTDAGPSSGFRKRVLVGCRGITSSFSKTKSFSTSCERFPLTSGLMDGFLINLWHS